VDLFYQQTRNSTIGYFVDVDTIWSISFREKSEAIKGRDDLRYYEAIDPVEIPSGWGVPTKINLVSDTSLAPLFEPSKSDLEMHRDRIHKRGMWSR
jgi:hypothetical protein